MPEPLFYSITKLKNFILNDFLNSSIMQYYLDHFEVLYVMLVGSRSFGIVTEDSDFDIAVFVKEINNSTEHKYGQWLTYHHRLVHNNLLFDTMHPIQHISGSWFLDTIDTIENPTHIFLV